jgi:transposase
MFLRDDQWSQLAQVLLNYTYGGGIASKSNRLFIEAVLWHVNSQRRWSDLPIEYGSWNTCYVRFRRWNDSGTWRELANALKGFPELASEFQKIVTYSTLYDARAIARLRRKESRENRANQFVASTNVSGNSGEQ